MIYLDNAATTALSETAEKAMEPYFSDLYGNPSSSYRFGQEAKRAIEAGRQALASFLHVSPREIYFTGGGTESDNWALLSLLGWGEKSPKHLLTSTIEHPAILRTASFLESLGVNVSRIPVDAKGFLDLEALENALKQSENTTCLVSVMAANNEIGTLQNLQEIGSLARRYGALFHTDAVQAFGQIPIAVEEMGIDLLSASSHKRPKASCFIAWWRTGERTSCRNGKCSRNSRFRRGGKGSLFHNGGKRKKETCLTEFIFQKTSGRSPRGRNQRGESSGKKRSGFSGRKYIFFPSTGASPRKCSCLHSRDRGTKPFDAP